MLKTKRNLYGVIEAGGTKMVVGIADSFGDIIDRAVIPTTTPDETLPEVINYFKSSPYITGCIALGAGFFGPANIDITSKQYGLIRNTSKLAWRGCNIVKLLKNALNMPIGFDTDVNAAVLAENRWGATQGLKNSIYMTIGTGIGTGCIVNDRLLHGLTHPEGGHMFIPRNSQDDFLEGCPYHQNCLEGLASGPSIKARWKVKSALELPPDHAAWDLEAEYLGYGISNYIMTFLPERIVLGGGVMRQRQLFKKVRQKVVEQLNTYVSEPEIIENIDKYIVPPKLGENAGLCGAIILAEMAS